MNNKGWGLEAMILWCAVLGVLLIVATVMINGNINKMYNTKNNNTSSVIKKEEREEKEKKEETNYKDIYESYLDKMTNAGKLYIEREYSNSLDEIGHMYLSTNFLINNDYLLRLVDPINKSLECIGYVDIEYINNEVIYNPFLKCGENYETKGYNSSHIE